MRKSSPQRGIPRHQAYVAGIAPAQYDLEHMIMAFGADNVVSMVRELARGNHQGVQDMLKHWTAYFHGDKFAMVDYLCGTETKYGLSKGAANTHGAGV